MAGRFFAYLFDYLVAGPFRRYFQNPKRILRDYVKPAMTVLDVGAGKGFFSIGMAGIVGPAGQVIAVDLKAERIAELKRRASRAGLSERIEARVGSERNLEIDEFAGQVDFALAYYVVHHAPDVEALMAEIYRMLKTDGKFLLVEPGHHASAEYCAATEAAARQAGFMPIDHPRLIRDWAVLLAKK